MATFVHLSSKEISVFIIYKKKTVAVVENNNKKKIGDRNVTL